MSPFGNRKKSTESYGNPLLSMCVCSHWPYRREEVSLRPSNSWPENFNPSKLIICRNDIKEFQKLEFEMLSRSNSPIDNKTATGFPLLVSVTEGPFSIWCIIDGSLFFASAIEYCFCIGHTSFFAHLFSGEYSLYPFYLLVNTGFRFSKNDRMPSLKSSLR